MLNPMDLKGRRILVTGASSGIGRATAQLISRLGGQVILVARQSEALNETASTLEGIGHRVEPFDLSKVDSIEAWLKRLVAENGPLSGLVHSAGIQKIAPLRFLKTATLNDIMQLNFSSAVALVKAFRQKGACTPNSSVVFLSSIGGIIGTKGQTAYAASKGALISVVRVLALELAPEGIRINCVAPGLLEGTHMTARFDEALPDPSTIRALHPLGPGYPTDVANAIAFLLGDTGRWITGTTLVVDGGYTAA